MSREGIKSSLNPGSSAIFKADYAVKGRKDERLIGRISSAQFQTSLN